MQHEYARVVFHVNGNTTGAETLAYLQAAESEESGGYKAASAAISGEAVYGMLKHESGIHRVQRVPATESQGRIHTSAVSVAILPQADEVLSLPPQLGRRTYPDV